MSSVLLLAAEFESGAFLQPSSDITKVCLKLLSSLQDMMRYFSSHGFCYNEQYDSLFFVIFSMYFISALMIYVSLFLEFFILSYLHLKML